MSGTISILSVPPTGEPKMTTRVLRVLGTGAGLAAGMMASVLFLGVPRFGQEMPEDVRRWPDRVASIDKNTLSEEEYREYARLVEDLQRKLDAATPFLREFQGRVQQLSPPFSDLSTMIE